MTLLDEPTVTIDLDREVEVEVVAPPSPKSLLARLVPALVVFALLGLIGGAGTFAAFSASTDNPATLATGSLVLANTVTGGPLGECRSDEGVDGIDTNANECDALFSVTLQKPGDEASNTLMLENVGSIDASTLVLYAAGPCSSTPVGTYSGTADICDSLQLTVEEHLDGDFDAPIACTYGGDGPGDSCAFDAALTVSDFVAEHTAWDDALAIGDLAADPAATRYFRVATQLDPDAENDVQGLEAEFSLTWRIEQ